MNTWKRCPELMVYIVHLTNLILLLIRKACRLYSNFTSQWNGNGISAKLLDGSLVEAVDFPWMVNEKKIVNLSLKIS